MPDKNSDSDRAPDSQPYPAAEKAVLTAAGSSAAICILDAEHRFVWVNHEFAALSSVSAAEHFGKTVREVLGLLAQQIEPYLQEVLASGAPILNVDLSAMHAARNKKLHLRMHFLPIRHEGTVRIGIVVNELTYEKKLEQAVRELDGKVHKEVDRLRMLSDISHLLASNWDLTLLFPRISAHIRRVLRQEMAAFLLYDAVNDSLVRQCLDFPLNKGFLTGNPVSAKRSPAMQSLKKSLPFVFSREDLQSFDSEIARSLVAEGLQCLCCVPMLRPMGPIGVLALGSTRRDAFVPDDLSLLTQVANQLALAMENHLAASQIKLLQQRLGEERKVLEGEVEYHFAEIVGNSPALRQVL